MMNKLENIINKLGNLTKENKLEWKRVETSINLYSNKNRLLQSYIKKYNIFPYLKEKSEKTINLLNSYVTNVDTGYVYTFLFEEKNTEYYIFAIQSNEESEVVELNSKDEYQKELKQLEYFITEKLNGVADYLNKLMEI